MAAPTLLWEIRLPNITVLIHNSKLSLETAFHTQSTTVDLLLIYWHQHNADLLNKVNCYDRMSQLSSISSLLLPLTEWYRNLHCFLSALTSYLNSVHEVDFPPDQYLYCAVSTMFLWNSSLCNALFILSMTFDRFYSIIRPHKAASFNTVKRAKITIVSIIIFSTLFNVPYLFAMTTNGR